MAEQVFVRTGFFNWQVFENNHRVGKITLPFLARFFFKAEAAAFPLGGENFELTFPKKETGFLGPKETSVKLKKEVVTWVEIIKEISDGNPLFRFTWRESEYLVAKTERGWRVFEEGAPLFLLETTGFFSKKFFVNGLDARIPLELVVAIVWAIQCPGGMA